MPNNKPNSFRYLNVHGMQIPLDTNDTVRQLVDNVGGVVANTADAMLTVGGVAYVVPAGKFFKPYEIIVYVALSSASGAGGVIISEGDTEDAETIVKLQVQIPQIDTDSMFYVASDFNTIASSKYVTNKCTTNKVDVIHIIGVESPN